MKYSDDKDPLFSEPINPSPIKILGPPLNQYKCPYCAKFSLLREGHPLCEQEYIQFMEEMVASLKKEIK